MTDYDFDWTLTQIKADEIPGVTHHPDGTIHIDRENLDEEGLTVIRTALSADYRLGHTNNRFETWKPSP